MKKLYPLPLGFGAAFDIKFEKSPPRRGTRDYLEANRVLRVDIEGYGDDGVPKIILVSGDSIRHTQRGAHTTRLALHLPDSLTRHPEPRCSLQEQTGRTKLRRKAQSTSS